jgi:DNA-binding MarR family transcriptional regulator
VSTDVPEPYLAAWRAVLGAHAASLERVESALAREGLPPLAWYDVLWPLYDSADRRLRMGELASRVVVVTRTGLTRLVDRMERQGVLRRERAETDRRGVWVVLTDRGAETLRRMWPVYAAEIRRSLVGVLSEDEAEVVRDALSRVRDASA